MACGSRVIDVILTGIWRKEPPRKNERCMRQSSSLDEGADMAEYAAARAEKGDRDRFLSEAKQLREHSRAIRKLIESRRAHFSLNDTHRVRFCSVRVLFAESTRKVKNAYRQKASGTPRIKKAQSR
jgi:hypothetical protein